MMTVTLRVPPPLNAMYRRRSGYGMFKTDECKVWEEEVKIVTRQFKPLEGPVRMDVAFYFQRDNRDIDGGLKALLDVLQGVFYENDKQIEELHITKKKDAKNPRVDVWVYQKTPEETAPVGGVVTVGIH